MGYSLRRSEMFLAPQMRQYVATSERRETSSKSKVGGSARLSESSVKKRISAELVYPSPGRTLRRGRLLRSYRNRRIEEPKFFICESITEHKLEREVTA